VIVMGGDDRQERGCCAPARGMAGRIGTRHEEHRVAPAPHAGTTSMVRLPGGEFRMGTDDRDGFPADGEGPVRSVSVSPFWIDSVAVSNDRFAEFVAATGYVTEAEQYGWSFVFAGLLPARERRDSPRSPEAPWWCAVQGASWRSPEGRGTSVDERGDHPAVHVSWHDATRFCAWTRTRLPTEAEWEYAARGGLDQRRFPWGDELTPGGEHRCNIWQGRFPVSNTRDDGYFGTAPVDSFAPNGFGLYNVAGNVWEWCSDWWATSHPARPAVNPAGPNTGRSRVMRGGSYLCHESYCNRYRVAARTSNEPDSASGNLGFRCARDA
jgi:formylglycine-generating enzyme required for sulfatase activity